jgi:nucleoside phosphorylase
VVLALLPDVGNNLASACATLLLEHFKTVNAIIMTGIGGGIPYPEKPKEHVRLGDIVVCNRSGVVQYDYVKTTRVHEDNLEWVETEPRHPPRPPSAVFLEAANHLVAAELEGNCPWVTFIEQALTRLNVKRPDDATDVLVSSDNPNVIVSHPADPDRDPGQPRAFSGSIASANNLLKDPKKRDQLRDKYHAKAAEMEGSGIADASWFQGDGYFVVRGICDYCDSKKDDPWQRYAAVVAAAYVRALLETMPRNKTNDSPNLGHCRG